MNKIEQVKAKIIRGWRPIHSRSREVFSNDRPAFPRQGIRPITRKHSISFIAEAIGRLQPKAPTASVEDSIRSAELRVKMSKFRNRRKI